MSRLVLAVLLVLSWTLLWGNAEPATVIAGVVVVLALYLVFPSTRPLLPRTVLHLGALVRLILYFSVQLVTSSVLIAREVVSRDTRLRSTIVEVDMRTTSQGLLTLITSMVALTPGTMAVAARSNPPVIKVHALVLGDPHQVAEQLWRLEDLCVRSFGTDESLAELKGADR